MLNLNQTFLFNLLFNPDQGRDIMKLTNNLNNPIRGYNRDDRTSNQKSSPS